MTRIKHALVTPLDWGLGHATRCIPIVRLLLSKNVKVSIASSGDALKLLQLEFPDLSFFELPSYRPVYSSRIPLSLKIFFQLHRLTSAIRNEQKEIARIIVDASIDIIISDNRYGCRSSDVQSVFITHQVNILTPSWMSWWSGIINYFNHALIRKFDACWIPDDPAIRITGKMTNPALTKSRHIGFLSRFGNSPKTETEYACVALISGPEPQRSIFESKVRNELKRLNLTSCMIKGQPQKLQEAQNDPLITEVVHLPAAQLQQVLLKAEMVVARSGYSTIMDLFSLGGKAIFIPTPGQSEQEYLAAELMKRKVAYSQSQQDFDLIRALEESNNYAGFAGIRQPANLLEEAIDDLLK